MKINERENSNQAVEIRKEAIQIAIVLAGGFDQIALIKELQKRFFFVILIDYFDDPPAREFADKHVVCSTLDVDKVIEIAKQEKACLVCTACTDQALLTVAKVSECLGLPCYIDYETARNVTNKFFMKQKMIEGGIPTSKYIICDSSFKNDDASGLAFPLVVKPTDCNSSKGVRKVHSVGFLASAVQDAIDLSRARTAIVEEFKEGDEFSVDVYVDEQDVKILSVTRSEKIKNRDSFTICRSYYPVATQDQQKQIEDISRKISSVFNLKHTPLLIQMIGSIDGFFVLEFSARMGGGSKYRLIEVLSGVNIMESYVDLILGGRPCVQPSKQVDYASCNYIYCHGGTLKDVVGFDELKSKGVISDYFLYKKIGSIIYKAETSGDRVAGYLIKANSLGELEEKELQADLGISILSDEGKDIMLHLNKDESRK